MQSPALHKLDMVAHTCNLSTQEVEYHKFKVIFGYEVNSRPVWLRETCSNN